MMKHYTRAALDALDARRRANLINCASGLKPAHLIGSVSAAGAVNLAIFNSIFHLGASPPLLGFVLRPTGDVPRHTYENLKETGVYTINHVHRPFAERAHYTSAKFERGVSEFDACGLTEQYVENFAAPFVAESRIKMGLRFVEELPVRLNGTIIVVGEIEQLIADDDALLENGSLDLGAVADVSTAGLDTYFGAVKIATYPYARPDNVPAFDAPGAEE
jgi:flavin reductase (DIM6/NTAB) family NADH-FMN oxidoreductase RutF